MRSLGSSVKSLIVRLLMLTTFFAVVGCGPRIKTGPRITSYGQLAKIGIAISHYADANGGLPEKLSDLVPRYIPADQMGVFYVTNGYANKLPVPSDWPSNALRIDEYGSYIYLGTNTTHGGVLAYEKVDLWKPIAAHPGELAVLFTDFRVQYLPTPKLRQLIGPQSSSDK